MVRRSRARLLTGQCDGKGVLKSRRRRVCKSAEQSLSVIYELVCK